MTERVNNPRLAFSQFDPDFGLQGDQTLRRRMPSLVVPAVAPAVSGSMAWRIMYPTKSSEPLAGSQTCLAFEISSSSIRTGAPLRSSSQRASPMWSGCRWVTMILLTSRSESSPIRTASDSQALRAGG